MAYAVVVIVYSLCETHAHIRRILISVAIRVSKMLLWVGEAARCPGIGEIQDSLARWRQAEMKLVATCRVHVLVW